MNKYIIGGWTQNPSDLSPAQFSYTMYGMITNLSQLTAGTLSSPGWSPQKTAPPEIKSKAMWTYGGGGCSPENFPANEAGVDAIINATKDNGWAGVDFDDECGMNIAEILSTVERLQDKQSSYTFLAGWDYNNPQHSKLGNQINQAVQKTASAVDRHILMCYASKMWSMNDIKANVGPAIQRTMDNGVATKQIILALTPAGLTTENRNYFLDQVLKYQIGGLFIWNYPKLNQEDLDYIIQTLEIES